eukprot:6392124-Prymnesium_polylepis.4
MEERLSHELARLLNAVCAAVRAALECEAMRCDSRGVGADGCEGRAHTLRHHTGCDRLTAL